MCLTGGIDSRNEYLSSVLGRINELASMSEGNKRNLMD